MSKDYFGIWKCAWDFHKQHANSGCRPEEMMKDAREIIVKWNDDPFLNALIAAAMNEIDREISKKSEEQRK